MLNTICDCDRGRKAGYIEPSRSIEIKDNGTTVIKPETGYQGIEGVEVDVDVKPVIYLTDVTCFKGSSNLDWITVADTSRLTTMDDMFAMSTRLTSLDLSNFDTSNVTSMIQMFSFCQSLTALDLSNFDTSNVTNMGNMFGGCSGLTTLDLSNFNTEKVTDMYYMFMNCSGLTTLDLSNFNTENVTDMMKMFVGCKALTTVKVTNCPKATQRKIQSQLANDISSYPWTLADGVITRG